MEGRTRGLEPGLLTGPHHVTQRQDGGAEAQRRSVDRHHDGLLEVDERRHKVSEEPQRRCHDTTRREDQGAFEVRGQRSDYLTASAMRLLSFRRSVVRRPIRYDGSRPLQKTVPTELNSSSLLSSAAALPSARHTSFMICRDGAMGHHARL